MFIGKNIDPDTVSFLIPTTRKLQQLFCNLSDDEKATVSIGVQRAVKAMLTLNEEERQYISDEIFSSPE